MQLKLDSSFCNNSPRSHEHVAGPSQYIVKSQSSPCAAVNPLGAHFDLDPFPFWLPMEENHRETITSQPIWPAVYDKVRKGACLAPNPNAAFHRWGSAPEIAPEIENKGKIIHSAIPSPKAILSRKFHSYTYYNLEFERVSFGYPFTASPDCATVAVNGTTSG